MTDNIRFVVDGELLKDEVHTKFEGSETMANLSLILGTNPEYPGIISKVNIYSSALSTARMVALSEAGGEECGAPGDYVSWDEHRRSGTGCLMR